MAATTDNSKPPTGVYKNLRLMHACTTVVGCTVHLQVKDGSIWEGIFNTFSSEFTICLDLAIQIDPKLSSKDCLYAALKAGNQAKQSMFFDLKDIVRISVTDVDLNYATRDMAKLTTDADISGYDANKSSTGEHRQLESWQDDDGDNANPESMVSLDDVALAGNKNDSQNNSHGWDPHAMFKYNEQHHRVTTTYDEKLTDYTVPLPKPNNTKEWRRKQELAATIAKEIESNTKSQNRLAKEDEGDHEEEKFSAVVRPTVQQNRPLYKNFRRTYDKSKIDSLKNFGRQLNLGPSPQQQHQHQPRQQQQQHQPNQPQPNQPQQHQHQQQHQQQQQQHQQQQHQPNQQHQHQSRPHQQHQHQPHQSHQHQPNQSQTQQQTQPLAQPPHQSTSHPHQPSPQPQPHQQHQPQPQQPPLPQPSQQQQPKQPPTASQNQKPQIATQNQSPQSLAQVVVTTASPSVNTEPSTTNTSTLSERSDTSTVGNQSKDHQSELARKSKLNPHAKEFVYKPRSPAIQNAQTNGANQVAATGRPMADQANSSPISQTPHASYYQQVQMFPHGLSPHQQQHHAAQFMQNHTHPHFQNQIHYMSAVPPHFAQRYIRSNFQNYHHRGEHHNNVRPDYSQASMMVPTSSGQAFVSSPAGAHHPMAYPGSPQQPMIYGGPPQSMYPVIPAGFSQHTPHVMPNPPPYDGSTVYLPSQNYIVNP